MKRIAIVWMAALALIGSSAAHAEDVMSLKFLSAGKEVKVLSHAELEKLAPAKVIEVYLYQEKKNVKFKAFPARAVFQKVYGKDFGGAEEILITCTDGFQPSIPAQYARSGEPYLAFERVGQEKFTLDIPEQTQKNVPLGPYFLVWENLKDKEIRAKGSMIWPYQMASVDLVKFKERFPKLAPKAGAGNAVKRGFLAYRMHCMSCHAIHGEGGQKARDLAKPSVFKDHDRNWLRKFIDDPQKVKPGFPMPGLNHDEPYRGRVIEDLLKYFEAQAS